MMNHQLLNAFPKHLTDLKPSVTLAINEESNRLMAQGQHIYKLGLGQSPFPGPTHVIEALRLSAGEKDYLPVQGFEPLREAIANWITRRLGIEATSDEIMIGPGSKEILFLIQMVHEGVLCLPSPSWVSYAPQARLLGKHVELLPTDLKTGWRLDPAVLDRHAASKPGPRLLLLNSPNNPTGVSLGADRLHALADIARRAGMVIVSDEIYGDLHHRGEHRSVASYYPEGTIITGGISKWCGLGGWRLGFAHFPPLLRPLLERLKAAASETFTSVSAPIQHASIAAFKPHPAMDDYLVDCRRLLARLGARLAEQLRSVGGELPEPEGGFYLFPSFDAFGEALMRRGIHSSEAMCKTIMDETGVATLPGVCFHRPYDEFTCRISYVNFDGANALDALRVSDQAVPIDDVFLETWCSEPMIATQRLADWFLNL